MSMDLSTRLLARETGENCAVFVGVFPSVLHGPPPQIPPTWDDIVLRNIPMLDGRFNDKLDRTNGNASINRHPGRPRAIHLKIDRT